MATAVYGSALDPHVATLRQFRDEFLLEYAAGRKFVAAYYRYSPPIADAISRSEVLRLVVRLLLAPVVLIIVYPGVLLLIVVGTTALVITRRRYYRSVA